MEKIKIFKKPTNLEMSWGASESTLNKEWINEKVESVVSLDLVTEAKEVILGKYNRGNNERLIPTKEELADKEFYLGIWGYIQTVSKYNPITQERFVNVKELAPMKIAKVVTNMNKSEDGYLNKTISRNSIKKAIDYFKKEKYLRDKVNGSEVYGGCQGEYYKLRNNFNYYVPLENEFLKAIVKELSQDAFKVYLIYYGFNKTDENYIGICTLNQEEILRRAGLSKSGKNYDKLRGINNLLVNSGLITQQYRITYDEITGREIKRNIVTIAPLYWERDFYKTNCQLKYNIMLV